MGVMRGEVVAAAAVVVVVTCENNAQHNMSAPHRTPFAHTPPATAQRSRPYRPWQATRLHLSHVKRFGGEEGSVAGGVSGARKMLCEVYGFWFSFGGLTEEAASPDAVDV
jgi:hypothetical protein